MTETVLTQAKLAEPLPSRVVEIVVGVAEHLNFMNVRDRTNPKPLSLDLSKRSELVFKLSDELINAGWKFQRRPITIKDDFGVNFSSYVWVTHMDGHDLALHTCFKIIYECARIGEYEYSLFMTDSHGQSITVDPQITNGAGKVP